MEALKAETSATLYAGSAWTVWMGFQRNRSEGEFCLCFKFCSHSDKVSFGFYIYRKVSWYDFHYTGLVLVVIHPRVLWQNLHCFLKLTAPNHLNWGVRIFGSQCCRDQSLLTFV